MMEDINLKEYPQASGVYWFICNDEIVYIGSSNNLYNRMRHHRSNIKLGHNRTYSPNKQRQLYQFLQQNQFEVQFQLTENYRDLEKQLMEKHKPIFNERYTPFSESVRKARIRERHKKYKKYRDDYQNQLCNYNGEIIKLNALSARFFRQGNHHPFIEAKKYLISN